MSDTVSAVVPVEGYPSKVVALIGRNICYVDRETGMNFTQQALLKMRFRFSCLDIPPGVLQLFALDVKQLVLREM